MTEGDAGLRAVGCEQAQDGCEALLRLNFIEALFDRVFRRGLRNPHLRRIALKLAGQLLQTLGVGSRKQQGLAAARGLLDNLANGVDKAHVEHPVGLIQHQAVQLVEAQGAALEVILNPARRADDDVGALFQRRCLRAEGNATAECHDLDIAHAAGQLAQLIGDLARQFAGRAEYQCLTAEKARVQRRQQADAERSSFAAAGGRLGDQVLTGQNRWQCLCLNRRHALVAKLGKCRQHALRQWQGIELIGSHGRRPLDRALQCSRDDWYSATDAGLAKAAVAGKGAGVAGQPESRRPVGRLQFAGVIAAGLGIGPAPAAFSIVHGRWPVSYGAKRSCFAGLMVIRPGSVVPGLPENNGILISLTTAVVSDRLLCLRSQCDPVSSLLLGGIQGFVCALQQYLVVGHVIADSGYTEADGVAQR